MLAVKSNESDLMFSEYRLPNDQMSKKKKKIPEFTLSSRLFRPRSTHTYLMYRVNIYIWGV